MPFLGLTGWSRPISRLSRMRSACFCQFSLLAIPGHISVITRQVLVLPIPRAQAARGDQLFLLIVGLWSGSVGPNIEPENLDCLVELLVRPTKAISEFDARCFGNHRG